MKSVFGLIADESQCLLLKRAAGTSRAGQWGLPGGGIKHGESPGDACLREIAEESGLKAVVDRSLGVFDVTEYFLCSLTASRDNLVLQLSECVEHAWVYPRDCLAVGEIMDLGRLIPLFGAIGLEAPVRPDGLVLHYPTGA